MKNHPVQKHWVFSMYESNKVITKSAAEASEKAIREAKLNGISITYLSGSEIIEEAPDGTKTVIRMTKRKPVPVPKRMRLS